MKIVIIGAGVAGLTIGWRLRQRGVDVTILERTQPGRGATWAAAGMLAVAGETGSAKTPEAEFARYSRSLWPSFAKELEQASGVALGFEENGALMIALGGLEGESLHEGPGLLRLSREQALAKAPMLTPDFHVAVWAPGEALVDPRALSEALACAFLHAGGTIAPTEAVVRFETLGERVVAVRTPFGLYGADAFVLAAGAWSSLLEGLPREILPPVKPVKGQIIALEPKEGVGLPTPVLWGNGIYLVRRKGYLLVGATMEDAGFDTHLTREAANWLFNRAVGLMPPISGWRIADQWAGLRPGSPDNLPLLGPAAIGGLYVATGQFRNGILFAPAVGELLCRLMLERRPEALAFDPRRFS